jgi:hypothetical protein
VTTLAGTFSADELEALAISLELVRYAAGPVDDSMVALPSSYRPAVANSPR